LQHATVFFTVYGTDDERQNSWDALKSATGMLRSEVGRNITARLTPSLEFILDALPETSAHIEDLLAQANQRDIQVAKEAKGKEFAGDPDPYVKPHEDDDEA
jgi:ribosome-binding factor A